MNHNTFLLNPVQGGVIKLRYTDYGDLIITPGDNPPEIVDAMLETGYSEEFCVAADFSPEFIAGLMEAGFLVMSTSVSGPYEQPCYILLPKLHLVRSVLFFENLHIKKSIRRYLNRYELRFDEDFDLIVSRCLDIHGQGWLTPPLVEAIRFIRGGISSGWLGMAGRSPGGVYRSAKDFKNYNEMKDFYRVRPVSFALYRDGKLVAGEFGITTGRVYTSYSGYYDECNAGTVQLIKTAEYLCNNGFAFFDLGMPLDYKSDLGAKNISPEEFVKRFRDGTR